MIYLILFLEFFKIGLFTIGGGFAMIPLIEEIAVRYGWMTESEFFDLIGVCESTPGPIAINMATYIGSSQGGLLGSAVATLGVVLPSFIIILIIATVMKNMTKNKFFKGFMEGVKPVIVALIMSTGFLLLLKIAGMTSDNVFNPDFIQIIIFCIITAVFFIYKKTAKKKMGSVFIIMLSAILGIVISVISEQTGIIPTI
ncbi:MAG: chromate transporter [Oscillospiraceae bacterium]|nr:chromate transporter [Oscillospiraceae bacterium]MBR4093590.1 chromate transporter [Oscillospiraceae bacterium]